MNLASARLGVLFAAVAFCGCAKFPENGAANTYTKITFRFRVQRRINTSQDDDPLTNYIYIVAIRASTDQNPDPNTNPQPVFALSPNGFVNGQPTHFVQFDSLNPLQQYPYRLFKFEKTGDPANPINLASFSEVDQRIVNFVRPDTNSGVLQFDLFTNQLVDTPDQAQQLTFLQVNFLTMNKKAQTSTSGRLQDFLGDNNNVTDLNKAVRVDLRTNDQKQNTSDYEPTGDVSDPDLDIVDWSVQVQRP